MDVYLYYMKPFRQVKQLTNHISPGEVLGGGNYATLLKYKCFLSLDRPHHSYKIEAHIVTYFTILLIV